MNTEGIPIYPIKNPVSYNRVGKALKKGKSWFKITPLRMIFMKFHQQNELRHPKESYMK